MEERCGFTNRENKPCKNYKGSCLVHENPNKCGVYTSKHKPCQIDKDKCQYHSRSDETLTIRVKLESGKILKFEINNKILKFEIDNKILKIEI